MRFYLSVLGDNIFCTFERIENNQPYYTTLILGMINYYYSTTICLWKVKQSFYVYKFINAKQANTREKVVLRPKMNFFCLFNSFNYYIW